MIISDTIKDTLDHLPDSPGVYIMKNSEGRVIYVGKAISLKNRVHNYFQTGTQYSQPKTRRLVQDIASIGYILVRSEAEALMLECNLIKQHHPHYNILLKDSKHFPYLRINLKEDFPRLEIVRRMPKNDRAKYFGPYLGQVAAAHAGDGAQGFSDSLLHKRPQTARRSGKSAPA